MEHHRHADEERRQERKDEGLQEGHEQFEQVDRHAARARPAAPTPSPRPVLIAPAAMMNDSSTASRMWPAIMLAKSRTASANTLAISPMISTGTSSGAIQIGPGQKCARYAFPPSRRPLIDHHHHRDDRQRRRHPDVAGRCAAQVRAEQLRHRRNRQQAEDVHRQHEEEDAPDVLDEAIGVLVQRRLGDFLAEVLAHRLEPVGGAGRHQRVDAARAAAAASPASAPARSAAGRRARSSRSDRRKS